MTQTTISLISIAVTILLGVTGYVVTYANNLRLEQQKAQLIRVNQQLRDLYGPLLALVSSSGAAWKGFRSIYRPGIRFFSGHPAPTQEDLDAWCLWIEVVFMPHTEQMAKLVTDHSDLLEENEIPQCLLDLCSHVAAYKAVLKAWDNGDYSRYISVIEFPADALLSYATERFNNLKFKQAKLIGAEQKSKRRGVR